MTKPHTFCCNRWDLPAEPEETGQPYVLRERGVIRTRVQVTRFNDGHGWARVWLEMYELAIVYTRLDFDGPAAYADGPSPEKDAMTVELSAVTNACAIGHHIAKNQSLYHLPQEFGGFK